MTDMPVFGILCCGKDIAELAVSVKCCSYITKIMKNGGYSLGGYHTALLKRGDDGLIKLCGDKLYHLCRTCDAVFTVGCDGFSPDDIIPDITIKLCESEAVFFTRQLCGVSDIGNYDKVHKGKMEKKMFSPSRSRAGILCNALVMNIRNDEDFIGKTISSMISPLSFAVEGLSGKSAESAKRINESLFAICAVGGCSKKQRNIFDEVQNSEIK